MSKQYITYKRKKRQGPAPSLTPGKPYPVIEERETPDGQKVLINNDRGVNKWYYRDAFEEQHADKVPDLSGVTQEQFGNSGQLGAVWVNCRKRMPDGPYSNFHFRTVADKHPCFVHDIIDDRLHWFEWLDESGTAPAIDQEIERRNKIIEEHLKLSMRLNMPGISEQEQEATWQDFKNRNNL